MWNWGKIELYCFEMSGSGRETASEDKKNGNSYQRSKMAPQSAEGRAKKLSWLHLQIPHVPVFQCEGNIIFQM